MTNPTTPVYPLPYEDENSQPLSSITGGEHGTELILAEQVEAELIRIDSDIADAASALAALEERTFRLAHVSLSGTVGTGTDITIPPAVRGEFRSYTLLVEAGVVGADPFPLVVRINGDSGSNYRGGASARNPNSGTWVREESATESNFVRTGFVGSGTPSIMQVTYRPRSIPNTGFVSWTSHGWCNLGGSSSPWFVGGGRWAGDSGPLTHFTIRTNSTGHEWVSPSSATLWGHA